jgi:hypothetical protein
VPDSGRGPGIWIFLLCAYLLLWVPLNFAALAQNAVPSLGYRGPIAIVELAAHAIATMLAALAGWMLWVRNPAARRFAVAAIALNALVGLQTLSASALPHDISPGSVLPLGALTVVHAGAWIVYLARSRRLQVWLTES